jgi:hypothetical protein
VARPREGPLAYWSADALTSLERVQAACQPGNGKGRRIRAAAWCHRNKVLTADPTSCWRA